MAGTTPRRDGRQRRGVGIHAVVVERFLETQWYLFSVVFLLGASYTLRHDRHVRVDVFYGSLTPRRRALIDLVGTLLFLLPFCGFVLWSSWPAVANSWAVREASPDPGGLPRYPIKALILVAFTLLILQGLAEIVRRVAILRGVDETTGDDEADQEPSIQGSGV
ncbi:MAG: TRAP transporter small permease subunit [Acidobacteriota bacterium]